VTRLLPEKKIFDDPKIFGQVQLLMNKANAAVLHPAEVAGFDCFATETNLARSRFE
jgi:hypothetical protein